MHIVKLHQNRAIGLMSRVIANGPADWGSIPGRVILKTQKMVLDVALLNNHHYKVRIKSKVEQSREWSGTFPKKETFGSPSTKVADFAFTFYYVSLTIQSNIGHLFT